MIVPTFVFIKNFKRSPSPRFERACQSYDILKKLNFKSFELPKRLLVDKDHEKITYERIKRLTPLDDRDLSAAVMTFLAEIYDARDGLVKALPFLTEKSAEIIWQDIERLFPANYLLPLAHALKETFFKSFEMGVFTDAKPDHFIARNQKIYRIDFDGFTTAHYLSDAAQFVTYMMLGDHMNYQDAIKFLHNFTAAIGRKTNDDQIQIFWLLCWYSNIKKTALYRATFSRNACRYRHTIQSIFNASIFKMTVFKASSIDDVFSRASHKLWFDPEFVSAPRGQKTREMLNAVFVITDPTKRLIANPLRNLNLAYFCGEFLWYQRANGNIDDISYYSKFWRKLVNEKGHVASCYGQRVFAKGTESQWSKCRGLLRRDPDTRRAVLLINTPQDQELNSLDIPCTNSLQFLIRDRKLYLTTHMRSNDLIWGFGYDVPVFTLWQEMMLVELQQLGVDVTCLGDYTHFATSLHSYMRHEHIVEHIAQEDTPTSSTAMPAVDAAFLRDLDNLMAAEQKLRLTTQKAIMAQDFNAAEQNLKSIHRQSKCNLLQSDLSHWMLDQLLAHGIRKLQKAQGF